LQVVKLAFESKRADPFARVQFEPQRRVLPHEPPRIIRLPRRLEGIILSAEQSREQEQAQQTG